MKYWIGMVPNKKSIFGIDTVSVVADTEATARERFIAKTGMDSPLYWTNWPDHRNDLVWGRDGFDAFGHRKP